MKIALLGAGAWGKVIGEKIVSRGHSLVIHHHTDNAWKESFDALVLGIPVQHVRSTLQRFSDPKVPVLSLSKGMEIGSHQRVSQLVAECFPASTCAVLSGPNFAEEVARGLPAVAVVASECEKSGELFHDLLHDAQFRLYSSSDVIGVELGGALKNVYAIAAGVCRELKLGENAWAGLLTRCLAEMTRIGMALGGRPETFAGLSGVGDLMLTASSDTSRNFRVGQQMVRGGSLASVLEKLGGVAEGVTTAKALYSDDRIPLDSKPIVTEVYRILDEGKPPAAAVRSLMERAKTSE